MAANANNGFDMFDTSDDFNFDSDNSNGFGDDFDSGFGDGGFGDEDAFGNADAFSNTPQQQSDDNQFSNSVNSFDNQNMDQQDALVEQQGLKKQSLIFIAVGIVAIILVFIIAGAINGRSKKEDTVQQENTNVAQNTQQNSNVNVDDIMSDGNNSSDQASQETNKQNVITNKVDNDFTWTLITDNENIQFNEKYSDMTFTVTGIEHKARAVDTNNNLVVISTLQGSISGLSGTYELDVPYNKGAKLVVGNSFTVHVQLGTYNGKTVVGEIQY